MKQKISVIGCGWLGFSLAKSLVKKGHSVKGSTTSTEKISTLNTAGIEGFLVQLSSEGIAGDIKNCLADSDVLILNIPPSLRKNPEADYVKQMQNLIPYVEASSVKKIVFVSSTAVYDDDESFPVITETSATTNTTHQLLKVETLFQNNPNFKTTILRFSGLFAEDRHPAIVLSGRHNIKNPDAPVNLIHRKDCIAIIKRIIEKGVWSITFNASTTPHPTKEKYYTSECESRNITLPSFNHNQISKGKIIDSSKLARVLDYTFKIKL